MKYGCGTCFYWEPPEEGLNYGDCRRSAPKNYTTGRLASDPNDSRISHSVVSNESGWPTSKAGDWCGEWLENGGWRERREAK